MRGQGVDVGKNIRVASNGACFQCRYVWFWREWKMLYLVIKLCCTHTCHHCEVVLWCRSHQTLSDVPYSIDIIEIFAPFFVLVYVFRSEAVRHKKKIKCCRWLPWLSIALWMIYGCLVDRRDFFCHALEGDRLIIVEMVNFRVRCRRRKLRWSGLSVMVSVWNWGGV